MIRQADVRRALGFSLFLGAIWVVAAGVRPATTYHLAPLLVAATLPFTLASDESDLDVKGLVTGAVAGTVLALLLTAVLTITDWLQGPSLLPIGGAVAESITFALFGGVAGLFIALFRRTR